MNMNMNLLITLFFLIMSGRAVSQTLSDSTDVPPNSSLRNNFQPSLAVVIGMLAVMFSLTFVLLLYAKFCHRATAVHTATFHLPIADNLLRSRPSPGVEKTVVDSLPFFRFSTLKGSKKGLECSVCIAKFLDVEILRLLPRCKHAFHMSCIDQWLEKHSTCPLCRRQVTADDLQLPVSGSWRLSELHVEREESRRRGSSRFSIGASFRKLFDKEDELPIQEMIENSPPHHKFKHRITVVSDVMLMNRWSDVTPSDLMFLSSELLGDSSNRALPTNELNEKRSMSEIVSHPRLIDGEKNRCSSARVEEERVRKVWLPMARKTAEWFANRDTRPPRS